MEFCWLTANTNDAAGLKALEEDAETCYKTPTTDATSGTKLLKGIHYKIIFDQSSFMTSFTVHPHKALGSVLEPNAAFFLQHFPSEFEDRVHWLQDTFGNDIEAGATAP